MVSYALNLLRRSFFPVSIAACIAVLVVAARYVDPVIGVSGTYALAGLLLGAVVYYRGGTGVSTAVDPPSWRYAKAVTGVAALAVAVGLLAESRVFGLALLPVGYLLVAYQFWAGASPRRLLPQVVLLFAVPPATKYLASGFYFGNVDILFHVLHIEQVLRTGTPAAITGPVDQYRVFPGMHVLGAALSAVTSLPAYDAQLSLGILTYAVVVVPVVYCLGSHVFGSRRVGTAVALAATVVYPVSFYATYFFPQSFTTAFVLLIVHAAYRASEALQSTRRRLLLLTVLLSAATVLSHHLVLVLFGPALAVVVGLPLVLRWMRVDRRRRRVASPMALPFLTLGVSALVYWVYVGEVFVRGFAWSVGELLGGILIPTSFGGSVRLVTYGVTLPEATVWSAAESVASLDGVYMVLLVAGFALGVVAVLDSWDEYVRAVPLLVAGVVGAALVFKTPLLVAGLERIRMPLSFFFAFVLGAGVHRLLTAHAPRDSERPRLLAVLLVVVLCSTAPVYVLAGDDLYGLHDRSFHPPQKQVEFSEAEYRSLAQLSEFVDRQRTPVSALWLDRLALNRFGQFDVGRVEVTPAGMRPERRLMVYRTRWPGHLVFGADQRIVMSESYLEARIATSDKVYTAGPVGLVGPRVVEDRAGEPSPATVRAGRREPA